MVRHWKPFLSLFCCSALLLGGCWNAKELEHLRYPTALGFDFKNGKYIVYLQLVNMSLLAKVETSGGPRPEQELVVTKGEGKDIESAFNALYPFYQQQINYSHIKSVVFGKGIMKKGITDILDDLGRYFEFRYTWWAFSSTMEVDDLFLLYPALGTPAIYSQLHDPMSIYRLHSYIEPILLNRFVSLYYEPGKSIPIPRLSQAMGTSRSTIKTRPLLKANGVCIYANQKFKGCLDRVEMSGFRWLTPKTIRSPITLFDGKGHVADLMLEKPKPKITSKIVNGQPRFTISVEVSGSIYQSSQRREVSDLEKLASENLEKSIKKTYLTGLKKKMDVYSFSNVLYRQHTQDWKRMEKNGEIKLTEDSLENVIVKVKIRDSGQLKYKGR